jgi:RNA methyltransferase, TrmH family
MPDKLIESRHNAVFKMLKDLVGGARTRRPHHAAWLEGARLCASYVSLGSPTPTLVVSTDSRVDAVDSTVRAACGETWLLDAKLFAEITQMETPIGWGLVIPVNGGSTSSETNSIGKLQPTGKSTTAAQPQYSNQALTDVIVFDRIQDPGNAGTMLRSAAASGVNEAWAITGTVDLWSPKVLRSAMGAHFVMSIHESMSTEAVILAAQDSHRSLLATANDHAALALYSPKLDLQKPIAWVFGQEGDGVSAQLLSHAQTVVIPQSDQVESLNVAAAASVCLFETSRRKRFDSKPLSVSPRSRSNPDNRTNLPGKP